MTIHKAIHLNEFKLFLNSSRNCDSFGRIWKWNWIANY